MVQEEFWNRRNEDIAWGILAWAVAISNFWVDGRSGQDNLATAVIFAIPGAWAFCVCTAMEHRQRRAIYLAWIWPSAIFAFMKWSAFLAEYVLKSWLEKVYTWIRLELLAP